MGRRNHPRPKYMAKAASGVRDEVLRACAVLELIGTPAAKRMREQLHAQLAVTTDQVQKAAEVKVDLANAKTVAAHTDSGFIKGVSGMISLIQIVDPKLHATLPAVANLSAMDPDGYAAAAAGALRGNGKLAEALAGFLDAAIVGRLEARKRLVKVEEDQMALNKGQASVSDLKSILQSALSLIHNAVEPGSPLLAMLKAPKKSKGKGATKSKSPQQPAASQQPVPTSAHGATTPQPAPTVTPTAGSSGGDTTPAPQPTPPQPASADGQVAVALATVPAGTSGMNNGVHA